MIAQSFSDIRMWMQKFEKPDTHTPHKHPHIKKLKTRHDQLLVFLFTWVIPESITRVLLDAI